MAAHCPPLYTHFFKDINVGQKSKGMNFDIPGITVLDTFHYINKVHRSEYSSLWLDSRAIHFGEMGKTSQPELSIDMLSDPDMTRMITYNLWD